MTGNINNLTNLHRISQFIFTYTDPKSDNGLREEIHDVHRINAATYKDYERRVLMYPYLLRDNEKGLAVAYFDQWNVIKLFIPKMVTKVTPVHIDEGPLTDYEGVFLNPANPESMWEYKTDKYITLLESSLGEDLKTFFITLHENEYMEGHMEDFTVNPGNIDGFSLDNKYLAIEALSNNMCLNLDSGLLSNDASVAHDGEMIAPDKDIQNIWTFDKGYKIFGNQLLEDCSLYYFGDPISSNPYLKIFENPNIPRYRKWWDENADTSTGDYSTWDSFQWAPNTTVKVNKEMVEGTQSIETFQKADKILSINVDNPNIIDVVDVGGGQSRLTQEKLETQQ